MMLNIYIIVHYFASTKIGWLSVSVKMHPYPSTAYGNRPTIDGLIVVLRGLVHCRASPVAVIANPVGKDGIVKKTHVLLLMEEILHHLIWRISHVS